jgi:site-specific DNA recombinase
VDKKILVVAAEAAAVRTIFARYLELGSIRALAEDLDRRGIRSKLRRLSNGRTIGGGRLGVGALAYLLKNRFYIGEVVYRGEVHRGEHEPILDSTPFEAVQAKLAAQARTRRCRLRGSPAILSGRLFDDRGNRMSPSHTNKDGARYRYYVSQAVLQRKRRILLKSDVLPLTQEFLSVMMGVQRTSVTLVARRLQAAGLIKYRRFSTSRDCARHPASAMRPSTHNSAG